MMDMNGDLSQNGATGADSLPAVAAGKATDTRPQLGALCYRRNRGKTEVLLVTSRDTGRWIIPKGWPMQGIAPEEAAAREAWEEAGVEGKIKSHPLGDYTYDKVLKASRSVPCRVTVYPLRVTALARRFPERDERSRKWFSLTKAAGKVAEPELRALITGFSAPET
ncbi:MAG: NUDIX hydrolase [Paracoccaceae bacterium]